MSGFWRSLVSDTQLRWLGPEKGVIHLATAAVVNAVWDLWAKREGKPLWKLLVRSLARGARRLRRLPLHRGRLAPEEALDLLRDARRGAAEREAEIVASGYPAYTTSAGWLGYSDEKVERPCPRGGRRRLHAREDEGRRRHRVGRPPRRPDPPRARPGRRADDGREPGLGRRRGDRGDASGSRVHDPWWIEEPTSPDDVLGHARIRREIAPDPRRDRRARPEPRHLQAALPGARRSTSARSTPAGSAA